MWTAVGESLPMAVGVALSPLPIVAVVLMLVTARGNSNGIAFVAGWLVGLAVVGAIVLAIAGPSGASDDGTPSTGASVVHIVLGALFLLIGFNQWRKRPRHGSQPPAPKWMAAIDTFTPIKAGGMGALFSGMNPKNTVLAIGAATTVAATGISGGGQAVAYGVFAVVASIGVGTPVAVALTMGDRAKVVLDTVKEWMAQNNAAIMTVVCLVLGAKLIGQGVAGF